MTALAVLRHGPTEWSEDARLQGRRDIPLSRRGREEVARWRLPDGLRGFDLQSSPLVRCVETARLLVGEPFREERLIEAAWGEWEGLTIAELRRRDPAAMAEAEARGLDLRPPGGESPRDVQSRLLPWLEERARCGRPTLAVTHKGVLRALYALATGWDMTGPPPTKLIGAACHLFRLEPSGALRVTRLNLPLVS